MEVAGANRRWRGQFRCRGSRRESAVAQLFSLGSIEFMHPILAMGDLATPVLLISLLMIDGILLIAVGLFALSLWKRSLAALIIAGIFVLIDGYLVITT